MPNHIKNRLTLSGDENQIKELIKKFSTHYESVPSKSFDGFLIYTNSQGETEETGWWDEKNKIFKRRGKENYSHIPDGFELQYEESWTRFPDFNKVFEMPACLEDFNPWSHIIDIAKHRIDADVSSHPLIAGLELQNRKKSAEKELTEDEEKLVQQAIRNYRECGYFYWYDWSRACWGTKWNAYSCKRISEKVYQFETAWSSVPHIIEKIYESFPDVKIFYQYADEDTGSNCGQGYVPEIKAFPSGSIAAYELYFELNPEDKKYYQLIDGEYKYVDLEDE